MWLQLTHGGCQLRKFAPRMLLWAQKRAEFVHVIEHINDSIQKLTPLLLLDVVLLFSVLSRLYPVCCSHESCAHT